MSSFEPPDANDMPDYGQWQRPQQSGGHVYSDTATGKHYVAASSQGQMTVLEVDKQEADNWKQIFAKK